jgi:hypothetical protein
VSRDVHPAVLNDGAEKLVFEAGAGGAVGSDSAAVEEAEAEAQPPGDPAIACDDPTDAHPPLPVAG